MKLNLHDWQARMRKQHNISARFDIRAFVLIHMPRYIVIIIILPTCYAHYVAEILFLWLPEIYFTATRNTVVSI